MDELKESAAHCGIEEVEHAELCIGGFIGVLKKSANIDDADVERITAAVDAEEAIKAYEKVEFRKGIPKPNPIIIALKPKPGPPPLMIARAVAKGNRRKKREDKDAMHTEDVVANLKGRKLKEEAIVKFMEVFVVFVEEKAQTDIGEILCLPEKE